MRKLLASLCLPVVLLVAGCRPATAPTPGTAPSNYQRAAGFMADFSTDLLNMQAMETNLYIGQAIGKPTHIAINKAFIEIAQIGPQVDALIRAQAAPQTILERVSQISAAVTHIVVAESGMDPRSREQFQAVVQIFTALLQNVSAQFNNTGAITWNPLQPQLLSPLPSRSSYRSITSTRQLRQARFLRSKQPWQLQIRTSLS